MSRWVTGIAIGAIAGIGLALSLSRGAVPAGLLATAGATALAALFPDRRRIAYGVVAIAFFWGGLFLSLRSVEHWQALPESTPFSGPAEIITRGEPRTFYRPMTLRPLADDWAGGDILYRAAIDFAGTPGERLDFSCQLKRPENFEPGFDYQMLLASRGTGYLCERGGQAAISADGGFSLRKTLYAIQSGFRDRVNALLPEPESGLLTGLLVGGGDRLAPETRDAFARAGLSHIVAVSGYNMSVVADGLVILALGLGLWRRGAVMAAVLGLALFLLVIDGSAASLRAALMAWLAFGAYFIGRPAASWNGLLLAGALMLLANPLLLRYDVGFQLSFLATAALLVFARHFETFEFFRHWYGKVAALFLTTVVIELFTLPVIVGTFGTFSLVAPLANALVLPLVPLAMFAGLGAVLWAAIVPALGFLIVPFVWLPLAAIIRSAEALAALPGASLSGLDSSPVFAVLWYLGLFGTVYYLERIRKRYVLGMDH
ncbi:MAG: ComEC/Rec2 family competence protein [Candidatus Moraniibacteriota bacterium]|nr:MAG: ComEC/Rec2 family competence protein [Candidatus Moranbacteria bacterium]